MRHPKKKLVSLSRRFKVGLTAVQLCTGSSHAPHAPLVCTIRTTNYGNRASTCTCTRALGGGLPGACQRRRRSSASSIFFAGERSVLHHSMALAVLRFLRGSLTANDHRLEATSQDDSRAARWRRFACEVNEGPPAPGLYKSCLQRAQAATTAESKITHRQIEKDLTRTFGALSG